MKSKQLYAPLFFTIGLLGACDYTIIRNPSTSTNSYTLDVNNLVISTPTTAAVSSNEFQLLQNGTGNLGCLYTGAAGATTGASSVNATQSLNSASTYLSIPFSYGFKLQPTSVVLRLKKTTAPTASMVVDVKSSSGGIPTGSALASSAPVAMSTVLGGVGGDITFSLGTTPTLSANSYYSIVLHSVASSGTIDGTNSVSWKIGNVASDCTSFSRLTYSVNSGSSWNTDSAPAYFYFVVPQFQASGSGYWIIDAGKTIDWDMSTFSVSENPSSQSGSISYSVGAGEDSSTPTYSQSSLTKTQVQALAALTGRYLYVQISLNSANANFSGAGIGSGSISGL